MQIKVDFLCRDSILAAPLVLDQLQACIAGHFDVEHSTFQFEPAAHASHEHGTH